MLGIERINIKNQHIGVSLMSGKYQIDTFFELVDRNSQDWARYGIFSNVKNLGFFEKS